MWLENQLRPTITCSNPPYLPTYLTPKTLNTSSKGPLRPTEIDPL